MGGISKLQFDITQKGELSFWDGEFKPVLKKGADFWRMFLDDGEIRELGVYSSAQVPVKIEKEGNKLTVYYDKIVAENGACYDIFFKVYIQSDGGALSFSADIENNADTRINELQMPFVDFKKISSEIQDEVLYAPNGLGARYENPRKYIECNCHSEYISADYKGIWYTATYPHCARSPVALSMPWLGVQSGDCFVYLGRHDEFFRIAGFNVGTSPRDAESRLMMTISHYPAATKGEKLHYAGCQLAVFKGDWRNGASYYKRWAENTWYKKEICPDWVKNMTGWQRIILKHQYGEIFFKYNDLPRVFQEGKKYGIDTLLVFGWWKGRFDNNYPEYEADPALGGEVGLKKAIADIHSLGGRVLLYTNGNLIDVKTDFYKEIGHKICSKDIDGNEYREQYRFSNDGTLLKTFGYKTFVTACHATNEWQERLLESGRLKLSFGADAIFYDQLCCCVKLCFDKTHLHQKRVDEDPHYRSKNIEAIKSLLSEDKALGTEWVLDRYTTKLHFTHGCGFAVSYGENVYPDLYRHTFPECIVSNRYIHDEKKGYKEQLNYSFVHGLLFDISIFRGRVTGVSGMPGYAEYVKFLLALKERYRNFFYHGSFESVCDLHTPKNVWAAKYVYRDKFIIALWNNTGEDIILGIYGRQINIPAKSVDVVAF